LKSQSVIQQGKGTFVKPQKPQPVKSQTSKRSSEDMGYLPKLDKEKFEYGYTLVVDLDETLVHYAEVNIF
jgi:hypothetical protein